MPVFRYKAVSGPGDVLQGDMEAPDQRTVIEDLRSRGYLPIRAEEVGGLSVLAWLRREWLRWRRFSRESVEMLFRELAMLLRAGLPLDQALEVMAGHAPSDGVRDLVRGVVERVRGGSSLADALAQERGVFDRFSIGMVRAGEAGGTLETVLARVADFMERSRGFRRDLQASLRYPVVLLAFAVASIAIIVTLVIPGFEQIFDDAGYEMPLATRIVMGVATTTRDYWWVPVVLVLLGLLVFVRQRRKPEFQRRWDAALLRVPVFGPLHAKTQTVRLSYTLGMLLSNGVTLVGALPVVRETLTNQAMVDALETIERQVKEGRSFAELLQSSGLFPDMATHLLRIGEETGRLDDMLFRVAETYEKDVQRSIQRLLTLAMPLVIALLAVLIGGIMASILIPMLTLPEFAF